jgi:mRNA interferase RelE/StbE
MYNIVLKDRKVFEKDISKLPSNIQKIILWKIAQLSENWLEQAQIKKLTHYKVCDYRVRIWDYRVLFNVNDAKKEIVIFRVLHRSKLY